MLSLQMESLRNNSQYTSAGRPRRRPGLAVGGAMLMCTGGDWLVLHAWRLDVSIIRGVNLYTGKMALRGRRLGH